MKLSYLPKARTYSLADIARSNERIDDLCARIEPIARTLFLNAVQRQSEEGASVLLDEAKAAVSSLLADPSAGQVCSMRHRDDLMSHLAHSLRNGFSPDEEPNQDWIVERGRDLARAIVGFWANLGATDAVRYERAEEVLDAFEGASNELFEKYQETYKTFGLEKSEAERLLDGLNAGVLAEVVVKEMEGSKAKAEAKPTKKKGPGRPQNEEPDSREAHLCGGLRASMAKCFRSCPVGCVCCAK